MSHLMTPNQQQVQSSGPLTPQQMQMMGQMPQPHQQMVTGAPQMTHNPSSGSSLPSGASLPQTQAQAQVAAEQRFDLIARVRHLVWTLKESLANLMKISASNIHHNSQIDSGAKTTEEQTIRFDKALEDFFSICNQIELNLKTIMECAIQSRDSVMYLPFTVSAIKTDGVDGATNVTDNTISYSQYLITIKSQVSFAKTVHDILLDGAKRISQNEPINQIIATNNTQPTNV